MKIGLSTSVIQRGKTGVAQYVLALTRAFLDHACEHQFTLFVLERDLPLFDFAREKMSIVPVPEKFRPPIKDILWHQVQLPGIARRLGLDLLHVPSYRRMIWRQPCPLVATIHDLAPFHLPEKYDWRRMLYARVCARQLARRQKDIIAISQTTARDIHRFFGIPLERMTVIYNGIDHERFRPVDAQRASRFVEERYGLKRPYFIYVSRLEHPAKNHVRLIAAFDAFKSATASPWQLVFAGEDWHGAEVIHAAAQKSPFASEIHMLGFVPGDDLPLLYRAAGACVYPSLYEGFGLPPVEAMACGCPVISSNRGSLGEVVGNAAMQVDPTNVDDWKNALAEVSSNESLRARLRNAGLNHAQQFDWQRNANATLAVYERALGRVPLQAGATSVEAERPLLRTVPLR